jgi:hypothetical protein
VNEEPTETSERVARTSLVRGAIIYTPLFAAGVILTALSLLGRLDAGPVLTVIEALLTVLFGHQSIQSLRDLRAELVRTEGSVGRKWSKMDFLVSRSYYVSIGRSIFRMPPVDWHLFEEEDRIAVIHYPHTGTVAGVERLPAEDQSRGSGGRPA